MRYIFHQRVIFVYLGLLLSYHDFICGVVAQKNHSQNERNEEAYHNQVEKKYLKQQHQTSNSKVRVRKFSDNIHLTQHMRTQTPKSSSSITPSKLRHDINKQRKVLSLPKDSFVSNVFDHTTTIKGKGQGQKEKLFSKERLTGDEEDLLLVLLLILLSDGDIDISTILLLLLIGELKTVLTLGSTPSPLA